MFSRKIPAHLLPVVEQAIENALGPLVWEINDGEYEVLVVPVNLPRRRDFDPNRPTPLHLLTEAACEVGDETDLPRPSEESDGA